MYDLPVQQPAKPDYTALDLPSAPPERPYVLVNMVMSADGRATIEGNEHGLGSDTDRRLMRELRSNADVVVAGAGTLRSGGTSSRVGHDDLEALRAARGKPPNPLAAVLSRTGDLPLDRPFFTAQDFQATVYLSEQAPEERRAAIARTGRTVVSVPPGDEAPAMLRHMRHELGAEVLLVEGGPSLNGDLFERGLVDEYFVTLGPLVVGGAGALTTVSGPRPPSLDSTTRLSLLSAAQNAETGEVYLRYRVAGRGAGG